MTFNEKLVDDVIERNRSSKKAYAVMEHGRKSVTCVKNKVREIINSREMTNAVIEFYKEVSARRNVDQLEDNGQSNVIKVEHQPEIIEREVELSLKDSYEEQPSSG